ncbi:hypothetical protein [Geodermatophilus sp. CPCC 206100]|uniref:hypothetical protein n=1 Tax=Geodermatophilus sp. CPCC 206100 TaxID=3020054 RepID=UPI003B0054BA
MSTSPEALAPRRVADGTLPDDDDRAHRPGPGGFREGLLAVGLFLVTEAALMAVIRAWQPRFFTIDDKLAQYLPVWSWLGRQPGVDVPLVDPDQGSGGAFVADLQYGVLDPLHWLLADVLGRMDGLNAAGWGLHLLAVTVLGLGVVALARHYGAGPVWSAVAAVGAVNSGYLLWFAASWWPAAWGTAVLPWLWWALVTRSWLGVPTAALAAYAIGTSGYPYSLPFAGLIVVAVVAEVAVRAGAVRAIRQPRLLARLGAAAGGLALAAPGILAATAMAPYSQRSTLPVGDLGSTGDFIPNLLDVLVGGLTSTGQVSGWWGTVLPSAALATGWFVLPGLALVDWRRVRELGGLRQVPGVLVSLVLVAGAFLATQLPTVVGGLRYPFRYVVILQVVLPLLVSVLASRAGLRFTRGPLLTACALLAAQGALGVLRTPLMLAWHLGVAVVGILVLVALSRVAGRSGGTPAAAGTSARRHTPGRWVALGVLVATAAGPLVSIGSAVAVNARYAEARGEQPSGLPADGLYNGEWWPVDVAGFRDRSVETGLNATVLHWGGSGDDRGLSSGVPVGSAALFSDVRPGYGYTSVGHAGWAGRWCQDFLGHSATCGDAVARLLAEVPGTGRTWLDASSKDVLLVDQDAPPEIAESLADDWQDAGPEGGFTRFERREPTAGRITVAGGAVTALAAESVGTDSESYAVEWSGDGDRRLVTRIPWWPGYEAELDGRPLDVEVVDDTLLAVSLPEGAGSGQLRISFEPPGRTLGLGLVALGAVAVLGACVVEVLGARRSR